jgi:hypothetical protein
MNGKECRSSRKRTTMWHDGAMPISGGVRVVNREAAVIRFSVGAFSAVRSTATIVAAITAACSAPAVAIDAPTGAPDCCTSDGPATGLPAGDSFDGTTLDLSWSVYNAGRADIAVAGGVLSIAPHGNALWFGAGSGPLVSKLTVGDFKITATVHARKTTDASMPPDLPIEVGGLMIRNPAGPPENYVFVDIGYAEQQRLGVEHKSTRDSTSTFDETVSGADADLRLCRLGTAITAWRRDPGSTTWRLELTVDRPDLPAAIQAGLDASTGQAAPNVTITFDAVAFDAVGAGCDR